MLFINMLCEDRKYTAANSKEVQSPQEVENLINGEVLHGFRKWEVHDREQID